MVKTKDILKKIRDMKGIFHAKMGTIKDRNRKDLMEAEEIKKRWQGYTELYQNILVTHKTTMALGGHLPKARHPGVWRQTDHRKHYY